MTSLLLIGAALASPASGGAGIALLLTLALGAAVLGATLSEAKIADLLKRFPNRSALMAGAATGAVDPAEAVQMFGRYADERIRLNSGGGVCIPLRAEGQAVVNVPLECVAYLESQLADVKAFIARPDIIAESVKRQTAKKEK